MEAELFDGTVLEFPDGTSPEVIQRVVKAQTEARRAAAPAPAAPAAPQSAVADVAQSFPSGVVRGAVETAMLPATAARGASGVGDWLFDRADAGVRSVFGLEPFDQAERDKQREGGRPFTDLVGGGQDMVRDGMNAVLHKPTTTAGKYANTIGEFVAPGGIPSKATRLAPTAARKVGEYGADVIRGAVVPGVMSEGLGQATEGTWAEMPARIIGAVGGNFLGAAGRAASAPEQVLRRAAGPVDDINWQRALDLQNNPTGIRLTGPEAITQAQDGASGLPNLQRVVEGSLEGRTNTAPFFAARPAQVDTAVGNVLDGIAPQSTAPSTLGPRAAEAAQRVIAGSPEAQAVVDAVAGAGPRTSAMQAGEVIQPALRETFDRREGMRSALADQDYAAARRAQPRIPVDNLQPQGTVREPGYTRLDPNVNIHGQAEMAPTPVPADIQTPSLASNTGPDMIQVDPRRALRTIDQMRASEKGAAAGALDRVRSMLFRDGSADTSVIGLENARGGINGMITEARQAGDLHVVERLIAARTALDDALATSPEFAQATTNFAAASRPLDPFTSPGMEKAVARDEFSQGFRTPAEDIPAALASPSELRNFNSVAPTNARAAMENRIATQLLDKATDGAGQVNGDRLALALRESEDLLSQYPDVAARLQRVVTSTGDMSRASFGPVGDIAKAKETVTAGNAILPQNPLTGSANEASDAVNKLLGQDADTTRGLVRQNLGDRYAKAATETQEGSREFAGAKFRKDVAGNQNREEVLNAVLDAIQRPQAAQEMKGLLDVLQATGRRKSIGSATAFNETVKGDLGSGSPLSRMFGLVRTLGASALTTAGDGVTRAALRNSMSELADLFVDPKSVELIRAAMAKSYGQSMKEAAGRAGAQSVAQSAVAAGPDRER